MGLLVPERE
ncbi:hypothetical protein Ocin01_12379 [Orchesella cincta]|uniref:Uncharacterized protein n=1 Tax=Orchesella cincta TaxID=48709 RepID=A0A1D2MMW1_ORCCI|nr:hypothetical protein Ocin01_12379 [Orchesella cincta]